MSRVSLRVPALAVLGGACAAAALAADSPQTVADHGSYMEAIGSVPAEAPSPSCSLKDLNSADARYIRATCARIEIRLPAGTVLTGTSTQVRVSPEGPWLTCKPTPVESAEYKACLARGTAPQTLPDGLVVYPTCSKESRSVCGNLHAVDFKLGNGNFSCSNMGDEARTVVFGLSNAEQQSLQYRAVARYKSCNAGGQIESN